MKSRPLWFWNKPLSREQTLRVMKASKEAGYFGLGILPSYGMTPEYMTPEFLAQYKMAIEIADSLGMKMCLYDEFYFPSGMAGGNLVKKYPEALSKRLDMESKEVTGPKTFKQILPAGVNMGAVGMEKSSKKRIDLSAFASKGELTATLPAGNWEVMIFTLVPDSSSDRKHCDYLSPEAVGKFINLTYDKYYETFPEHFGTPSILHFMMNPACVGWMVPEPGPVNSTINSRQNTGTARCSIILHYGSILVRKLKLPVMPCLGFVRNYMLRGFRKPSMTGAAPIKFS
jgi:hypothetical protein